MSRIGRLPVTIPEGVQFELKGHTVKVNAANEADVSVLLYGEIS